MSEIKMNNEAASVSAQSILPENEPGFYDLLLKQASLTPDHCAVVLNNAQYSYHDIVERSGRLAAALAGQGVHRGTNMACLMDNVFDAAMLFLASLKLSANYIPLTISTCRKEIIDLFNTDQDLTLVTDTTHWPQTISASRVIQFESLQYADNSSDVKTTTCATDYIYSSYQMGRNVPITQSQLLSNMRWAQQTFPLNQQDVMLHKVTEDAAHAALEIIWPLLLGARLAIYQDDASRSSANMLSFISRNGITVTHLTPTELNKLLRHCSSMDAFKSLRTVFCSGELLSQKIVNRFFDFSSARLVKIYNNSNLGGAIAYTDCAPGAEQRYVSIAQQTIAKLYVLDSNLSPSPVGAPGDVYLSMGGNNEG